MTHRLRFPVVTVLRMVAGGMTADEIVAEHPDLEDVPAALAPRRPATVNCRAAVTGDLPREERCAV